MISADLLTKRRKDGSNIWHSTSLRGRGFSRGHQDVGSPCFMYCRECTLTRYQKMKGGHGHHQLDQDSSSRDTCAWRLLYMSDETSLRTTLAINSQHRLGSNDASIRPGRDASGKAH